LRNGTPSGLKGCWFVGSVLYLARDALLKQIANAIGQYGLSVFEEPANRANLLLLKREAFSHEAEVRVIFVQKNAEPHQEIVRIPIEPSAVFDEISFDPRLETFERREREAVIRSLGYDGSITESDLYQRTLLQVDLAQKEGLQSSAPAA